MFPLRSERGAAAVEFALVVPVLLTLLLGTIEFGSIFNAQISVTHAARETARSMAVTGDWTRAEEAGRSAAPSLASNRLRLSRTPELCAPGTTVNVVVDYDLRTFTGFVGGVELTGKAAMRCGG